jgi:hypothetical protein
MQFLQADFFVLAQGLLHESSGGIMNKSVIIVFSLFCVFLLAACGSSKLTETDTGDIPSWYMNPPSDVNYLYSAVTATSKDMQLAVDKATTDARADIGRQVELKSQSLQKNFAEEVGAGEETTLLQQFTAATKNVVNVSLTGSKVIKKELVEDSGNYRAYVLVQYPVGSASQELMEALKKNEELYTRFRSSQAHDELDKEVKKYEEWKKNQ